MKNKKGASMNVVDDWKSKTSSAKRCTATDVRIAHSMEEIARYTSEIKQMLQDLSVRPEVDNAQLQRIANAASEIARIVPALLLR